MYSMPCHLCAGFDLGILKIYIFFCPSIKNSKSDARDIIFSDLL
jgi:hypothetical protein